jgi:DNA-binding FadR family transcriptional regulator
MTSRASTRSREPDMGSGALLELAASGRAKRNRPLAIAEVVKDWIAERGLKPGDRLPQERDLISQFGVSKGTIREALKALDAQGIIKTRTGPGGGAFIAPVTESGALELLGNYFFFKGLTIGDIYQLRIRLEPEATASVVGRLGEADFARLESKMKVYEALAKLRGRPEFSNFWVIFNGREPPAAGFWYADSARNNKQKARNHRRCRYGTAYPHTGGSFKGNCFLFSRKQSVS